MKVLQVKTRKKEGVAAGFRAARRERQSNSAAFNPIALLSRSTEEDYPQAKLKVGSPGDIYEQEADQTAEQVMNMPEPVAQRQIEEEEEPIQEKSILQRQVEEEEEPIQEKSLLQRQAEEEEEPLQEKSILQSQVEEEEEPIQEKSLLQRQAEEEEEPVQEKSLLQRQTEEEEEPLQTKSKNGETPAANPSLESQINSLKGGGRPLPKSTRAFFETRFGADFGNVRIHTDSKASEMAKAVNAQAFTTGSNVAFAQGKYDPDTSLGKRLLGHELTHVVQQSSISESTIQRIVLDDITQMSITQEWARDLTYEDLEGQIRIVRDQLYTLLPDSFEYENAISNLDILEREVVMRSTQQIVHGDITHTSITQDWARHLADEELEAQIRIVHDQLYTLLPDSSEYEVARSNLDILEREVIRRIPSVEITGAAVNHDRISITLAPTGTTGDLTLRLTGPGGNSHTIRTVGRTAGTYDETFDIPNLTTGEYDKIEASWHVNGADYTHDFAYHIRVLGDYRHSQYNIPHENRCGGDAVNVYITDAACNFTPATLRAGFVAQVNLNGSGVSIDHGNLQREAFCLRRGGAPADARGRSFRQVGAFTGSCNGNTGALNNTTVAHRPRHPHLGCNDRVYIHAVGIKTVTDLCPGCAVAQLDNFTTDTACAGIRDLGNFMTIKLF